MRKRQQQRKNALGRETLKKLSNGDLSMVAAGTSYHIPTGCPNHSCLVSCPVGTGCVEALV